MRSVFKPVIASCLLLCTIQLSAQQPSQDSMMKAWTAYMTPGEPHKMIAKTDGEWETTASMWMDPSAQPVVSKGTSSNKMIMGGRYQESRYKGDMMGQPMEGIATLGYDNAKKVFQTTWIDNMGTGVMTMSGTWDDASKTINFTGMQTDPSSGKDMKMRETVKFIDDNNMQMEMFTTPEGGSEMKMMEIKYKRKGK